MSRTFLLACLFLASCRPDPNRKTCDPDVVAGQLVINEVVSKNEGVAIDDTGATEDYVELVNVSERTLSLGDFSLNADEGRVPLPKKRELRSGERVLLWADNDPEQGELHLPFKISSQGEWIRLSSCGEDLDRVAVPSLAANASFARYPDATGDFERCRFATPGKDNGEDCSAPAPEGLVENEIFADFEWPESHPALPAPLLISEVFLGDAPFVEVRNVSSEAVALDQVAVTLGSLHHPGQEMPAISEGEVLSWTLESLGPGEVTTLAIPNVEDVLPLPEREGVVSLFLEETAVDRVDFMHFPVDAALVRPATSPERWIFCDQATPGAENECGILASREVGNRTRGLRTLGDFDALAEGGTHLGTKPVKFIVDRRQGGAVHYLSAEIWPLHYTFVREVIEENEPLDRCDEVERARFDQGWYEFSVDEYFATEDRKYSLGTLVKHGAAGVQTIEFTRGDEIVPVEMREAFFLVTSRVLEPTAWSVRPQSESQIERLRTIEGSLPIVAENAPFADLIYQPLTHGIGYGVLTWVAADDLDTAALGSQVLLVTDDVPNDIPLVGGLITEAFQTPLAHVNVLSQNRGTPNMAFFGAREDSRIQDHLGQLVRLEVSGDDFTISEADPDEAAAFWEELRPDGPTQSPRLDLQRRSLVELDGASLQELPSIGAKAAQLAELYQVARGGPEVCEDLLDYEVPPDAFAIPVVHFVEHFESSGAKALYEEVRGTSDFDNDPLVRADELAKVRERMLNAPVDEELLQDVVARVKASFGNRRVRFRSSSNAEDLPGFNGAGLYTSISAELDDPQRRVDDALRTVWASLFNARAYDERELARVNHDEVAMGILVHEAFTTEAANGVGISRNLLDPNRSDIYYLNAQAGEAAVTNPAPGVLTEAMKFQWPPRTPLLSYQSKSSLIHSEVLSTKEATRVACALYGIHSHFRPLLDPDNDNAWFAMEIEFKLRYPSRELVVKQARPHEFGGFEIAGDCREL